MDIEDFDTTGNAGVVMQVKHPIDGMPIVMAEGKPVTITVSGVDGDRYRAALTAQINRRLRVSQNNRSQQQTAEEILDEALELTVACTLSWEGIYSKGAPLVFSPQNATQLYLKLPWLREQVKAFIEDRANFLKASAAS